MKIKYNLKKSFWENIFLLEILKGLQLTLKRLFSKSVTVQYPDEKKPLFPGFRGKHALVRDPDTGQSKCVACLRCASVCPSRCIKIRFSINKATGARQVESYEIDALRCIFCGYCEEVCPVNAVVLMEEYEYSDFDRQPFSFDMKRLLENWDEYMAKHDLSPKSYLNPYFRPRGLDEGQLPAAKRIRVPEEWTRQGQVVWKDGKAVSLADLEMEG